MCMYLFMFQKQVFCIIIFIDIFIYIKYSNIVLGSRREATGLGIPIYINMYVSKKETYIYICIYIHIQIQSCVHT